jgi:hypothetical protein
MLEDPALHNHNRPPNSSDSDVFPPRSSSSTATDLPYNPDGMIEFWIHEYEAVLGEVFGEVEDDHVGITRVGMANRDDPAWNRLDAIMRRGRPEVDDDDISDSESVVSVGELGQEARLGIGIIPSESGSESGLESDLESSEEEGPRDRDLARQQRRQSGNENTWEHMSPTTLSLLPRSPAEAKAQARRRSSSSMDGSGEPRLRLVNIPGDGDAGVFEDDEMDIPGPMPIVRDTDDEGEREFGAVDEVEYAYGE